MDTDMDSHRASAFKGRMTHIRITIFFKMDSRC